jgi:hypothetical protein
MNAKRYLDVYRGLLDTALCGFTVDTVSAITSGDEIATYYILGDHNGIKLYCILEHLEVSAISFLKYNVSATEAGGTCLSRAGCMYGIAAPRC